MWKIKTIKRTCQCCKAFLVETVYTSVAYSYIVFFINKNAGTAFLKKKVISFLYMSGSNGAE